MPFETVITAPDGSEHAFYSDHNPSAEERQALEDDFSAEWNSFGQGQVSAMGNAFARGGAQSAASLVEGFGDITGLDSVSDLGRGLKESAAYIFDVDPAREQDYSTKGAGIVGQGVFLAFALILARPALRMGWFKITQGLGKLSRVISEPTERTVA